MRKIFYTLAFVALTTLVATAQSKNDPNILHKKGLTTDASTQPVAVEQQQPQEPQQEPKKDGAKAQPEKKAESAAPATSPQRQTRMAINEKGVPASKEQKSATTPATEKPAPKKSGTPAQPTTSGNN